MVLTPRGVLCSQANVLTCQLSQDQVQTDYVNVHMSGKHHFSKVAMHAVAMLVLIDHLFQFSIVLIYQCSMFVTQLIMFCLSAKALLALTTLQRLLESLSSNCSWWITSLIQWLVFLF